MTMIRTFRIALATCVASLVTALVPAPLRAEVTVFKIDIGLPNTVALMVRGEYNGNEILRVKSAIAEIESGKRIIAVLDSPGGRVDQGEALGRFFYDAKIP